MAIAIWCTFLKFELEALCKLYVIAGGMLQILKKGTQRPVLSAAVCHTWPDHSPKVVSRGQEGPKGSKGTLRPDFQAYTWPMLFYNANVTHMKYEGGFKEIQAQLA